MFPLHPTDEDFSQWSTVRLPGVYPPDFSSAALLAWEAMTLKALCLIYFNVPAIEMFALIRACKLPSTDELSGDFFYFFCLFSNYSE